MAEILSEITGNKVEVILQEGKAAFDNPDNVTFEIGGDTMQQDSNGGFIINSDSKPQDNIGRIMLKVRGDMD